MQGEVREEHRNQINELPDAILVSILALLPFREVIRTSTLSRRWRYIWTLNPNLNLLPTEVLGEYISAILCPTQVYQELVQKYVKILNQILHAHPLLKVDLLRIELFNIEGSASVLSRWLNHVFTSGVEKLEINVSNSVPKDILFVFDTLPSATQLQLKYLHLYGRNRMAVGSFDCFRCLKALTLEGVIINNDKLKRLLSNCVSLEWMRLTWDSSPTLVIDSPTTKLKYLSIISCMILEKIEVCSKSLTIFELGHSRATFIVEDVPSVTEAWFRVLYKGFSICKLPTFTCQLQKLILNFYQLDKIPPTPPPGLSAINVKVLVLNISTFDDVFDLHWVFGIVKNCPLLQELQLHYFKVNNDNDGDDGCYPRIIVDDHTLPQLKVVEISGFSGQTNQIEFAIDLFNHAMLLFWSRLSSTSGGRCIWVKENGKVFHSPI